MAIRYYDESVVEKFKRWVKDPNMKILSPNQSTRFFNMQAEINNDKPLTLPLIAISRDQNVEILSTAKKALTYDGGHLAANKKKSETLNGIPIQLSYQIDIYTKEFGEADEYARNFVFNIINYPKISIEIPYNDAKVVHDSNMMLQQSITDNSDIPEHLIDGQFTRLTLRFIIDDAYLFSVPFMDNWNIIYKEGVHIINEEE